MVGGRRVSVNQHFDNENTFLAWFSLASTISIFGIALIPWEASPGGKISMGKERKAWMAASATCQVLAAAIFLEGARRFFFRQRELICGKLSTIPMSMWTVALVTLVMLAVALWLVLIEP
jgi:uncharacterized membrane protein YidH (DUF202 family)